jgi:1,2-diacylglycerol 3-alpha-glucosyltransferase
LNHDKLLETETLQGMDTLISGNQNSDRVADQDVASRPVAQPSFQHVFVLCTGRCGSVTFAKACGHFSNYTSGHETRISKVGDDRLAFADGHIEVDNRLAWFLGRIQEKYGDQAFYVHLTRDEHEVAASYDRRWHHHCSMIQAFDQGIARHEAPHEEAGRELVRTINENIRCFLRDKPYQMTIDIAEIQSRFPEFVKRVGAQGDLDSALAEFSQQHNATAPESRVKSKQSLPIVRLTMKNRKLQKRVKQLQLLAIPGLLLFSPLLLAGMFGRWALRSHLGFRNLGRRWLTSKRAVCDAYLLYQSEGLSRALEVLLQQGPKGSVDLFTAMDAKQDQAWKDSMQSWAQAVDLPAIGLSEGDSDRFLRWEFETLPAVESPEMVSVIMPCFNAEETLELAVRSILNQTWHNLELLIVNDCSTDATAEIAERLAEQDDRIRVFHNPCNVGPYVSKNRAVQNALGTYVTGHDADDIAVPTRIADQMKPILSNPRCKATIGYMIRVDRQARFAYPSDVSSYSYDGVAKKAMISLLVERELLTSHVGYWDGVRFGGDSEFLRRVSSFLGPGLRDVKKILMVCLFADGSLTNNQQHGVTLLEGVSPIREQYRRGWSKWHQNTPKDQCRVPFPMIERAFEAPASMLVPEDRLRRIASLAAYEDLIEARRHVGGLVSPISLARKRGRIGIVCYWFNRGQAVVGRRIRTALEEAGFETFVLARPTKDSFVRSSFIDQSGVWAQDRVTPASRFQIPEQEYLRWAAENRLDAVLCDQNLQFSEIAALRRKGIQTIGRFVWEAFGPDDVSGAKEAFDVIYSLTRCEQKRYADWGIESPLVHWGCPPELVGLEKSQRFDDEVRFFYPGGYLSDRKPTSEVLEAFQGVQDPRARLILKVQHPKHGRRLARQLRKSDPRIQLIVKDLPDDEHYRLMANSDVLLAPTRWEGLGLHHSEAIALGLPCITNDFAPMNESVTHEEDGLLIPAIWNREIAPGVPRLETPVDALRGAMERMCNDQLRERLVKGVERRRDHMQWNLTQHDFVQLILGRLERALRSA